jgi:subtilisin family serine protease
MRAWHRRGWVGVMAVLAVAGTRCSDTGPTGWIPRNGTINGVITATAASLAPPRVASFAAPMRLDTRALARPPRPLGGMRLVANGVLQRRGGRSPVVATPHDLIVTFRHTALGVAPVGSAALAAAAGARGLGDAMRAHLAQIVAPGAQVSGLSPAILTAKIRVADTTARDAIATALRSDPAIAGVSRSRLIWLDPTERALGGMVHAAAARTTPDDPFYPFQSWHYGLIDLPRAWAITTGSAAVLVAVVDDGIRFDHPDIRANLTTDGHAFINKADSLTLCSGGKISNSDNPANPNGYGLDPTIPASYSLNATGTCYVPDALGAHGLHVAGTIGAVGNNGTGVTGVNWTVRIRPVRVLGVGGFGEDYDVAQGVLYAAGLPADNGANGTVRAPSGAQIINLSLGGPDTSTPLHNAIIAAANAGALVVAAAGNADTSAPSYPAAYPEVLAVAAVGPDGLRAPYSNYGPYVALAAPGGNFALGDPTDGVTSTAWDFSTMSPVYAIAEGTSMATPHVSGVAALLLAQTPGLTAAALRSRLTSYAVGPATLGAGLVNAYNSLTQSFGPPTQLYARLYLRPTGAIVATVATGAGGTYQFDHLADGIYDVYGGTDESGDQQIGLPGRRWGAFGGSATPGAITVVGAVPYAASFSIGFPTVQDPDSTLATAHALVIGGYAQGRLIDSTDVDFYQVQVPAAGSYTFETSGWVAACGFALEAATAIGVFDPTGKLLTQAGYIDYPHDNFCSRLTASLSPGTYYVGVAGILGRRYRLQVRSGG